MSTTTEPLGDLPHHPDGSVEVTRMFRVANVIEDEVILRLDPGTSIGEALGILDNAGVTHAPVVLEDRALGIFSAASVAECFVSLPRGQDPRDAEIDDYLRTPEFVRAVQPLSAAIHQIEEQGVALVGTEEKLLATIQASQVQRYMWRIAQPFSLVHDIEMAVRHVIQRCCEKEDHALEGAITRSGMKNLSGKSVDMLTLGQSIGVGTHPANHELFSSGFGSNFELARTKLKAVVNIRNRTFHFSGDVGKEDTRILTDTKTWLDRRIELLPSRLALK